MRQDPVAGACPVPRWHGRGHVLVEISEYCSRNMTLMVLLKPGVGLIEAETTIDDTYVVVSED